jgi:hypothetical protein
VPHAWSPTLNSENDWSANLGSGAKLLTGFDIVAVSEKTSTGHTEYAEQVQKHQDDHDQSEDSDASTPTPSPISVIASAATEQE